MKTIKIENTPTAFFLPSRDLQAVYNAVSKEETRHYLNGVFVEQEFGNLRIVATDGHVLLRKLCADSAFMGADTHTQHDDGGARGFILRIDPADKSMKAKTAGDSWIYGDTETGIAQVVDFDGDVSAEQRRVGVLEFDRIAETFPDWRRVMPSPSDAFVPVNVDLDKLAQMQKAAKVFSRDAFVSIRAGGASGPMEVVFKYVPDMLGIVMPVRV